MNDGFWVCLVCWWEWGGPETEDVCPQCNTTNIFMDLSPAECEELEK